MAGRVSAEGCSWPLHPGGRHLSPDWPQTQPQTPASNARALYNGLRTCTRRDSGDCFLSLRKKRLSPQYQRKIKETSKDKRIKIFLGIVLSIMPIVLASVCRQQPLLAAKLYLAVCAKLHTFGSERVKRVIENLLQGMLCLFG